MRRGGRESAETGNARPRRGDTSPPGGSGRSSRRDALRLILGGVLASVGLPRRLAAAAGGLDGPDVLVGTVAELAPGTVKTARFHGMPILLLNVNGKPEVLSAICTHEGCTVAWDAERKSILCPCHGGQYDRHGNVVEGPPPAPLIQLPVRVEDGKIYVVE